VWAAHWPQAGLLSGLRGLLGRGGRGKSVGLDSGMRLGFGPQQNREKENLSNFPIFYNSQIHLNSKQIRTSNSSCLHNKIKRRHQYKRNYVMTWMQQTWLFNWINNSWGFISLVKNVLQISVVLPHPNNRDSTNTPIQESVKSISALFQGKAPNSAEKSLREVDKEKSRVMSEVSSKTILSQLYSLLGEAKIPAKVPTI
jgi:hypothetical protein